MAARAFAGSRRLTIFGIAPCVGSLPKGCVAARLSPLNRSLAERRNGADYVGRNGAARRIGRAMTLRTQPDQQYDRTRKELGHRGPYLPILLEAQEEQLSYEYRDGAMSYGAYTFSMAKMLRENRARRHQSVIRRSQ